MAEYKTVEVQMWDEDPWFDSLLPDERLLFIFLFTNRHARLCGIYPILPRNLSLCTGIERGRVNEILAKFADDRKAFFENGIMWVVNLRKHQDTGSGKVAICIQRQLDEISDCPLKQGYLEYQRQIEAGNTVCIPYPYPMHITTQLNSTQQNSTITVEMPPVETGGGIKELDLDIKDECYPKSFIEAYEPYPVKVGKADAAACWKRMKPDERAALVKAIGRIAAFTAEFPAQLEYTMNAGRFFRSGWRDWVNGEPQGLRTKAEANQRKNGGAQTYAEPDLPDFNIPEHLR